MTSANRNNFTSLILISFSCLDILARMFSTVLNRNDENEYPCLVHDLRRQAFKFSCEYVSCGLVFYGLDGVMFLLHPICLALLL